MTNRASLLLTSLGIVVSLAPAYAASAGSLDNTFGNNGVVATPNVTGTNGIVNSLLLDSSGNILVYVGGNKLVRYTTGGALDTSFGSRGTAALATPVGGSPVLQSNGQIVIAGVVTPSTGGAELGAERLNANGTPDTSFGSGGLAVVSLGTRSPNVGTAALIYPSSVANAGDILTCTTLINVGRGQPYQTALARFTSTGAVDTSFGTQGLSIQTGVSGCSALALLSTGGILVVNSQAVAQFTSTGNVGPLTGGAIVATSPSSAAFVPSIFDPAGDYIFGTQLFVGSESRGHNSSAQILRFTQTGTQVANVTFHYVGTGGSGIEALVNGVAAQSNGNIAVVGIQETFTQTGVNTVNGLARLQLSSNGTLAFDPTFGSGGIVVNTIPSSSAVVVQSDGKIVTAGFASDNTTLTLARYLGN